MAAHKSCKPRHYILLGKMMYIRVLTIRFIEQKKTVNSEGFFMLFFWTRVNFYPRMAYIYMLPKTTQQL